MASPCHHVNGFSKMDDKAPLSPSGCGGNTVSGESIQPQNEIHDRKAVISHNSLITERAPTCPGRRRRCRIGPDRSASHPDRTASSLSDTSLASGAPHPALQVVFLFFSPKFPPDRRQRERDAGTLLQSWNVISEAASDIPSAPLYRERTRHILFIKRNITSPPLRLPTSPFDVKWTL